MSTKTELTNPQKSIDVLIADISQNYAAMEGVTRYESVDSFVFEQYCTYCDTGQYPYLDRIVSFILPKLPEITEEQRKNLKTQTYIAADKYREIKRQEYHDKMLADGWRLLTENICRQVIANKKKILLAGKVDGLFRPVIDSGGKVFLIAPGKRTRGQKLSTLLNSDETDCFCKVD